MFAEPEMLFGNLDELCCVSQLEMFYYDTMTLFFILMQVTYAFCKEFITLLTELVQPDGYLPVVEIMSQIFLQSSKAASVSKAYHRYALNYINALNYLDTLRSHTEFCDFEKVRHSTCSFTIYILW